MYSEIQAGLNAEKLARAEKKLRALTQPRPMSVFPPPQRSAPPPPPLSVSSPTRSVSQKVQDEAPLSTSLKIGKPTTKGGSRKPTKSRTIGGAVKGLPIKAMKQTKRPIEALAVSRIPSFRLTEL